MCSRRNAMSSGPRTNDSATRSTPIFSPTARCARSSSGTVASWSSGPGMFSPWREATAPPISTSALISIASSSTAYTRSRTAPSARYMTSPGAIAPISSGRATSIRAAVAEALVVTAELDLVAGLELGDVVDERADPELRPRQVLQHRDRPAGAARGLAHALGRLGVLLRACRARSSGARRPSRRRPSARASQDRGRPGRSWRRSSCGAARPCTVLSVPASPL